MATTRQVRAIPSLFWKNTIVAAGDKYSEKVSRNMSENVNLEWSDVMLKICKKVPTNNRMLSCVESKRPFELGSQNLPRILTLC